mmetsp:Transcript_5515/g.20722  ORF Transcript_5515/g.20722 Transcript_5515/m.20722 type:complete len:346 (-) Transcript_5515:42-1079(-)
MSPSLNFDLDSILSAYFNPTDSFSTTLHTSTTPKPQPLPEHHMLALCRYVRHILIEEGNVSLVSSPVNIVGDIHGQYHDLLELIQTGGTLRDVSYVFMGDYVDRGYYSVETLTLLMLLKAKYPSKITLLRGNHETRQITQIYGFYDECKQKYGNARVWQYCADVFDVMNVAAVIDSQILCVHGGLSPDIKAIDQIRTIERKVEIPHEGAFCDIVWSDPDNIETWNVSARGAGWLYGSRVTREFNHLNGLDLICRAHQLMHEGFAYHFEEKSVVTVWSAPNYCYRCGNQASVLSIAQNQPAANDQHMDDERIIPLESDTIRGYFKVFNETSVDQMDAPTSKPVYFL